ncbi:hypothetical protein KO500_15305 [Cellulophaga baltica]|uniref:hypothetical protein n=1 Tax=Cellulophaga TaxID=104264 RepID=UPI001C06D195|nr:MULTISPECIES: hypothetical protein [Cellulophaga]MBU2997816.1 hypothetical protein [Cellulophaga baltica]MDO6769212.1 hypothetical protein [Cellulophaga sp. 1_MG-2023]
MRKLIYIGAILLVFGCSKNNQPDSPDATFLIFPLQNSECTTGESINQTTRIITFEWEEADHTDSYELTVENLLTNSTQIVSTNETFVELPVKKGMPFSWSVTSKNTDVDETATSEEWKFYNAGAQTSYAPFPADILSPSSGESVFKHSNDEVTLIWEGTDVDLDIDSYEVYFSTSNPPTILIDTLDASTEELDVTVASSTIYYWKIKSIDEAGNTSSSGVYSFRVY